MYYLLLLISVIHIAHASQVSAPCGGEIDVCEIKNIKCKQVTEFQLACNRQRPAAYPVLMLGGTAKNKGVREKRDNRLKKF